jgi:hypothetical protein
MRISDPPQPDFGNQFVAHHGLTKPEIANCARLSALFGVLARIRFLPRSRSFQALAKVDVVGVP